MESLTSERMSTETLMKVLGIFHTTFGGLVMLLQGCCAFAGWFWTNYPYNLFEDMFLPGLWIGIPIFCLGVACILQFRFPRSWLHKLITVFTLLVIVNSSFMLAFKIHFLIDDPEAEMYHDCANPFAPYKFWLDEKPHCLTQTFESNFGIAMVALAVTDIVVAVVGFFYGLRTQYAYNRVSRGNKVYA